MKTADPFFLKLRRALVLAIAPVLLFSGPACGSKASSGELDDQRVSAKGDQAQSAAEGLVLVTDNLNIDFSKYQVTFIELGADRCIPCKAMQPIMKEIAAEYKGRVQVVFYDVWKNPEPGRKYGVQLIPTQVFIDTAGREISRHVGLFPKAELVEFLKQHGVR
jgi:thioredoxin 1